MKKSKKLLSLVMALVMVFTMISGALVANASTGVSQDVGADWSFSKDADAASTIDALSDIINLYLPDILTLVGADVIEGALGVKIQAHQKDANGNYIKVDGQYTGTKVADVVAALYNLLAPAAGVVDDYANPTFYYEYEHDANGAVVGEPADYTPAGFTLWGLMMNNVIDIETVGVLIEQYPDYATTQKAQFEAAFKSSNCVLPGYDVNKALDILYAINDDWAILDDKGNFVEDGTNMDYIANTLIDYSLSEQGFGTGDITREGAVTEWTFDKDSNPATTNDRITISLFDYQPESLTVCCFIDSLLSGLINQFVGDGGFLPVETVDEILATIGTSLRFNDVLNMIDGLFYKLGKNPIEAIMSILPSLGKLIDEIVVPLLIAENIPQSGEGEGSAIENILGLLGSLDLNEVLGPTFAAVISQKLPLDLNELLVDGWNYKVETAAGDGTMETAWQYLDEEGKIVVCAYSDVPQNAFDDVENTKPVLYFESPLDMAAEFMSSDMGNGMVIGDIVKDMLGLDLVAVLTSLKAELAGGKINLNASFPDGILQALNFVLSKVTPNWTDKFPTDFNAKFKAIAAMEATTANAPAIFDKVLDLVLDGVLNPLLSFIVTVLDENLSSIPYVAQIWEFLGGLGQDSLICSAINSVMDNPAAKYQFTLPKINKNSLYYILTNIKPIVLLVMDTVDSLSNNDEAGQEPDNTPEQDSGITDLLEQIAGLFKDDNGNFQLPKLTEEQKAFATPVVEYPTREGVNDPEYLMDYAVKQFDIFLTGCDVEGYEYEGLIDTMIGWEVTDEYAQKLFPAKEKGGERSFVNYIYDNVFTNKVVSAAVTNVYGLIEDATYGVSELIGRAVSGLISPQKIASLIGKDCGDEVYNTLNALAKWSGSDLLSLNWGFQDGDVDGCLKALAASFRILSPILEIVFSSDLLGIYERVLLPVYETLAFTGTYSLNSFKGEVANGNRDVYLLAVVSPIVHFALDLAEAPMTQIATLIPRLAYFVTSGTITTIVRNLVNPILDLIKSLQDSVVGDLINGLLAPQTQALAAETDDENIIAKVTSILEDVSKNSYEIDIISVLNSVIDLVLNKNNEGEPIQFKLRDIKWGEVAGYGEITKMAADSTYNTIAVAHPGAPLIETIHYLIENIQEENNNNAIMALLANFDFDEGTQEIINMVVGMLASMSWEDLWWTIYDLLLASIAVPGMEDPSTYGANTGDDGVAAPMAFTAVAVIATVAYVVLTVKKKKEEETQPVKVR